MFKIIFLGTAASTPSIERNLPSIALVREGSAYLFDCGEGTQRQMLKFGISYAKVRSIFLSHLHLDHVLGIFGLSQTIKLNLQGKKLQVLGPKGTSQFASSNPQLIATELAPGKQLDMGDFTITPVKNKHNCKESFAFIMQEKPRIRFHEEKAKSLGLKGPLFTEIQEKGKLKINNKTIKLKDVTYIQEGKKIVYSGDTAPCAPMLKAAKNADILIHESTFSKADNALAKECLHSTAEDAALLAKKAGVKMLILTHVGNRYPPSQLEGEAKAIFPNTILARDGMCAEIR
ncbi:Ribonuclease Z [Candidatus Anstonella stagnisolia]|nr:Ribonuclease Z [Candidatus Anstonella stagnisolia]